MFLNQTPRNCLTRFIPTRVGQIPQKMRARCSKAGSSPRVWGRCRMRRAGRKCGCRFIPTRVGQMRFPPRAGSRPPAVHPHACGADSSITQRRQKTESVHPHACGADPDSPMGIKARIPVHPHACGADFEAKGFQAKV